MNEVKWHDVESPETGDYLERIVVPGGWLYRCILIDEEGKKVIAMTFVPDPSKRPL